MHHCFNKIRAFQNFARVLKGGGRLVIADVYHGSKLARHFDTQVARFCVTGHKWHFGLMNLPKASVLLPDFKNRNYTNLLLDGNSIQKMK